MSRFQLISGALDAGGCWEFDLKLFTVPFPLPYVVLRLYFGCAIRFKISNGVCVYCWTFSICIRCQRPHMSVCMRYSFSHWQLDAARSAPNTNFCSHSTMANGCVSYSIFQSWGAYHHRRHHHRFRYAPNGHWNRHPCWWSENKIKIRFQVHANQSKINRIYSNRKSSQHAADHLPGSVSIWGKGERYAIQFNRSQ